jgi:transcriptional regulator with XRE-family HTH domain
MSRNLKVARPPDVDDSDVGARLAERLHALRAARGYSLDTLAGRSGVSRSAISMIERNQNSPTAVVLEKLATGLGVALGLLFDPEPDVRPAQPISRRAEQVRWKDTQSGYVRRNVSPANWASPIRIVEVEFPAGATVAFDTAGRDLTIHQQVWVLSGEIELTVDGTTQQLSSGDCLAMTVDQPITFRNTTKRPARYAAVTVAEPAPAARRAP